MSCLGSAPNPGMVPASVRRDGQWMVVKLTHSLSTHMLRGIKPQAAEKSPHKSYCHRPVQSQQVPLPGSDLSLRLRSDTALPILTWELQPGIPPISGSGFASATDPFLSRLKGTFLSYLVRNATSIIDQSVTIVRISHGYAVTRILCSAAQLLAKRFGQCETEQGHGRKEIRHVVVIRVDSG